MSKAKRMVCLAVAVFMTLALVLSGCGSKPAEQTETTAKQEASATEATQTEAAKPQLEPYEIHWYQPNWSSMTDIEPVEQELNKYLGDKINATVKLHVMDWNSFNTKIGPMMAANEPFDIVWTAYWAGYRTNAVKGAFLDLTELLDKAGQNTKALYDPAYLNGAKIDGKLYALPVNKDKAKAYGFLYRKDIVEKHGLDVSGVKSWEDMMAIYKTLKEKEAGMTMIGKELFPTTNEVDFDNITGNTAPAMMYNKKDDGKVYFMLETPEIQALYKTARQLYTEGYCRKDILTYANNSQDVAAGKVFSLYAQLKPGLAEERNAQVKDKSIVWGQIQITDAIYANGDITGSMHAISKTSKDPERAMMLLELANSDPFVNNSINYGVENKHYKKVDDKFVEPIKDSGYGFIGTQWFLPNQYINYLLPGENPDKWKIMDEFNKSAKPSKSVGFTFNPEPVKNEIAALGNANQEYGSALYYGAVDPDKVLPKHIEKAKAAGAEKVIAEVQRQYDEWKAANK